ncbi:MAG: aminotransferase class I/II-fold pyridoxal phosphate-dependent enzyme, partial [Paracoccaceae bacterium]
RGRFAVTDWDDTLVHLYSFSKSYRLTGHRVGAIATSEGLIAEIEKYLDTVTICPSQVGQRAALWGMRNLRDWLAGERLEILDRRAALQDGLARLSDQGWQLKGIGAYFAYVEHPYDLPSDEVARRLVAEAQVLVLPATMFTPAGDADGKRHLRIAFANADRAGLETVIDRLRTATLC